MCICLTSSAATCAIVLLEEIHRSFFSNNHITYWGKYFSLQVDEEYLGIAWKDGMVRRFESGQLLESSDILDLLN